jgi:ribosomal protein S18 acetylase RimI-like enzyme
MKLDPQLSPCLIGRCRVSDFQEVIGLLRQLWPANNLDPVALRKIFRRGLISASQAYLCARIEKQVVGFGSLTIKNNLWQEGYVAHIDELIVDRRFRKNGIGTLLLDRLILSAKKRKCKRIELDTAFRRKEAHSFYRAHGFENRAFLFSKTL